MYIYIYIYIYTQWDGGRIAEIFQKTRRKRHVRVLRIMVLGVENFLSWVAGTRRIKDPTSSKDNSSDPLLIISIRPCWRNCVFPIGKCVLVSTNSFVESLHRNLGFQYIQSGRELQPKWWFRWLWPEVMGDHPTDQAWQLPASLHPPNGVSKLELAYPIQGSMTAHLREEIRRSPVEVGSLSHYLQGFSIIPGGCEPGFLNHQQYRFVFWAEQRTKKPCTFGPQNHEKWRF